MCERRTLLLAVPAAGLLAACAGLGGPPRLVLSVEELARLLGRQFPAERRLYEVLDVTASAPQLRLLPARGRLAAMLDIGVRERITGGRWQGSLEFDSALRWNAADRTLRLADPQVVALRLTSSEGALRTPAERIGAALAERLLDSMVVYTLPPERAEQLRLLGVSPADVVVTSRGVEVTFAATAR